MTLSNLLTPTDRAKLAAIFPTLDLDAIKIELRDRDGPGGIGGWVPGNLWCPSGKIYLDRADFHLVNGLLNLSDPPVAEVMAHELVHIEQGLRGFWYRLKMWWWRKFIPYNERPHEIEAYERAALIKSTLWT